MCGMVLKQEDMPFTKEGLVPDIIINPHAIPSRMTINQFLEVILGKSCCMSGHLGDATPFQNNDVKEYGKVLQQFGYDKNGDEVMYNGINGEQIKTSIFIGPTYYQRLKIMVADKVHSRATGLMQSLVRQPVGGKSNNGGGRIGEMERDSIIAHGISSFLKESNMERSDKFKVQIDKASGLIQYDEDTNNKCMVNMPYSMKLLLQELQAMSISARVVTESNISNKAVFNYLADNYNSGKGVDDIYDEEVEVENLYEEDN
jgi:DNA-directed RNA polymerase II subunit RPB2